MRHNHHSFRQLMYPKDLRVYLIQDKKRSCMVDIDTTRPIWARWLVPRKKPSLPCRWPQLWHIGIRRVLLWVTLLCAGMGKRCSCGEPLPCALSESPALSDSLSHSLSLTNAHTYAQANKPMVPRDVYLHLWNQRKTNCHQKATYGLVLMVSSLGL